MTERMTDGVRAELLAALGSGDADRDDQKVVLEDWTRATRTETEQAAKIEALTDALRNLRVVAVSQGVSEHHGVIKNADLLTGRRDD
jgi:hypothetical protein